jgi:hypothetical protein
MYIWALYSLNPLSFVQVQFFGVSCSRGTLSKAMHMQTICKHMASDNAEWQFHLRVDALQQSPSERYNPQSASQVFLLELDRILRTAVENLSIRTYAFTYCMTPNPFV